MPPLTWRHIWIQWCPGLFENSNRITGDRKWITELGKCCQRDSNANSLQPTSIDWNEKSTILVHFDRLKSLTINFIESNSIDSSTNRFHWFLFSLTKVRSLQFFLCLLFVWNQFQSFKFFEKSIVFLFNRCCIYFFLKSWMTLAYLNLPFLKMVSRCIWEHTENNRKNDW